MNREELTAHILDNMHTVNRGIYVHIQAARSGLGISPAQIEVLIAIGHAEPIGVNGLAKQLRITPGAVSQVVEQLVQLKLVDRRPDPADRRKQQLHITSGGQQLIDTLQASRQALFLDVIASMTNTELANWLVIQRKIIEQLEKK